MPGDPPLPPASPVSSYDGGRSLPPPSPRRTQHSLPRSPLRGPSRLIYSSEGGGGERKEKNRQTQREFGGATGSRPRCPDKETEAQRARDWPKATRRPGLGGGWAAGPPWGSPRGGRHPRSPHRRRRGFFVSRGHHGYGSRQLPAAPPPPAACEGPAGGAGGSGRRWPRRPRRHFQAGPRSPDPANGRARRQGEAWKRAGKAETLTFPLGTGLSVLGRFPPRAPPLSAPLPALVTWVRLMRREGHRSLGTRQLPTT